MMRNVTIGLLAAAIAVFAAWANYALWQKFTEPTVVYEVEVFERVLPPHELPDPRINALLTDEDWAEVDRQSDCLYDWLLGEVGHDITFEIVWAAGYWTDALGGACLVIGEDDE